MKKYDVIIKEPKDNIIELTVPNEHIETLSNSIPNIFDLTCKLKKVKDCTLIIKIAAENKINFHRFIAIICYLKNLKFKKPATYTENIEAEVKILEIDRKKIVQKITSMGAEKIFENDITTTWFDYPDNSIKKTRKTIRLRKIGNCHVIGYKGPPQDADKSIAKIKKEVEAKIDNCKAVEKFLNALNLYQTATKEKHRISYNIDGVLIEFDKISKPINIPEFLEIEADNEKTVLEYVKKIGYSEKDCKSWGSQKLIEYYSKKLRED